MRRVDVMVDVTGATGFDAPQSIAATVFMPDAPAPRGLLFAAPGGGYSRHYFDLRHPGFDGYSQAEHHARSGWIMVTYDHLGVGDSTTAQVAQLSLPVLARANDAAVRTLHARIVAGEFGGDPAALGRLRRIGLGQSMGGAVTIVAQGRHRTFDAVGILGFSAIHTCLPQKGRAVPVDVKADAPIEAVASAIPDFLYPFHWEETPQALLDADLGGGYPMRRTSPPWGSLTLPACAATLLSPDCVAADAAAIRVPVLVAVGERDVCPDPQAEHRAYASAPSVELCVIERMAHMHNFAPTRAALWARIEAFARRIAA